MGTYTELYLCVRFKPNIPEEMEKVLEYLFSDEEHIDLDVKPKHPLFECPRWTSIGKSGSYYHCPHPTSNLIKNENVISDYYLTTRFDLKNYNKEIENFLNYIEDYIDAHDNDYLGHIKHESGGSTEEPLTILRYKNGKIMGKDIEH